MQHEHEADAVPSDDRSAYMVEAFRPAGGLRRDVASAHEEGRDLAVLAVIDIPGDETTLFVLGTGDATRAMEAVRDLGLSPIRATEVRWSLPALAGGEAVPVPTDQTVLGET